MTQQYPTELLYTPSHEWVRKESDQEISVGVTEYAQKLLGELVFIELPKIHQQVVKGEEVVVLESVKTAADVYSPLAGEITAVNADLQESPNQVNQDPYGRGWLFKLKINDLHSLNDLLNANAYRKIIDTEAVS